MEKFNFRQQAWEEIWDKLFMNHQLPLRFPSNATRTWFGHGTLIYSGPVDAVGEHWAWSQLGLFDEWLALWSWVTWSPSAPPSCKVTGWNTYGTSSVHTFPSPPCSCEGRAQVDQPKRGEKGKRKRSVSPQPLTLSFLLLTLALRFLGLSLGGVHQIGEVIFRKICGLENGLGFVPSTPCVRAPEWPNICIYSNSNGLLYSVTMVAQIPF